MDKITLWSFSNPKYKTLLCIINGEITNENSAEVQKAFESIDLTTTKEEFIILETRELTVINSQGLGLIIDFIQQAKINKKQVIITSAQPNIREVMELVNINEIAPLCENLAAAFALITP